MRYDTNVSVWHAIRKGWYIPLKALDMPRSLLRPPRLISKSSPYVITKLIWLDPLPRCGCGKCCGVGMHAYESARWILGTSIGGEGGASVWRGLNPGS